MRLCRASLPLTASLPALRAALTLLVAITLWAWQASAAAELYKWVDERGVIHYSGMPPDAGPFARLAEAPVGLTPSTPRARPVAAPAPMKRFEPKLPPVFVGSPSRIDHVTAESVGKRLLHPSQRAADLRRR